MKAKALLFAAIAAFGTAPDAFAAAEARLDVFPERPRVGERVTVQLRTYDFLLDRRPPTIFPDTYPMTLNVLGPKRQQLELGLARDPQDPYVWRRSHRFPSPGRWIVCGANWQGSLEGCVDANLTRRIVRVRPRTTAVDVWHRLQRPLRTPSAATGTSCTLATPQGDLSALGFVGTAWGPGPAYPSLEADAPRHRYLDPIPQTSVFYGSKWFGGKTLWVFDRVRYRGPVLIRGRRVDGPEQLRFDRGRVPPRELRIAAHEESRPSFTRVQASGCYAFQVDGLGFSYTIVFSAIPG